MRELSSIARQVLGLIDLTSLNETDSTENIVALCRQVVTKQDRKSVV